MHAQISGTVDFREPDDDSCITRIRSLVEQNGRANQRAPFNRQRPSRRRYAAEELYGIFEADATQPYDMREIIARIVDGSKFDEYNAEYGKTVIVRAMRASADMPWASSQIRRSTRSRRTRFGRKAN